MKTGNIEDFMEFTTRIGCINNCRYCPQTLLIHRYKERSNEFVMAFKTFKTIVDKLPKDLRIDFSGLSEPWLNKDCTKMLLYAYNSGHKRIAVFTTGVGMSKADVDAIKHIPFITFVLHLPDKENNTDMKMTDEKLELLKYIKESHISNFKVMSMGEPLPGLEEIFGYVRRSPMHRRAGNLKDSSVPQDKYYLGPITCLGDVEPKRNEILPNGEVFLCCNDYSLKHMIGNLLTGSYEGLYKSDEFKKVVRDMKKYNSNTLCRCCVYTSPVR